MQTWDFLISHDGETGLCQKEKFEELIEFAKDEFDLDTPFYFTYTLDDKLITLKNDAGL